MKPGVSMMVRLGQKQYSARITIGLLLTVAPSRRRCTSVRSRMASCGGRARRFSRTARVPQSASRVVQELARAKHRHGPCCHRPGPRPHRHAGLRQHGAVLVAIFVLQPAPRLHCARVVHHLHDERPPRAHLHLLDVEPELQGDVGRGRLGQGKGGCSGDVRLHTRVQAPRQQTAATGPQDGAGKWPGWPGKLLGVQHADAQLQAARAAARRRLTPRKASSSELLPSDWPPIATISGMGRFSPNATAAACRRLRGGHAGRMRRTERQRRRQARARTRLLHHPPLLTAASAAPRGCWPGRGPCGARTCTPHSELCSLDCHRDRPPSATLLLGPGTALERLERGQLLSPVLTARAGCQCWAAASLVAPVRTKGTEWKECPSCTLFLLAGSNPAARRPC